MLSALLTPINKIIAGVSFVLIFIAGIFGYGAMKKREGKKEVKVDELTQDVAKRKNAREAAFEEKRNVNGVSDSDLVDRLRRRDDDWGSL